MKLVYWCTLTIIPVCEYWKENAALWMWHVTPSYILLNCKMSFFSGALKICMQNYFCQVNKF